jgi:hypothetical protein
VQKLSQYTEGYSETEARRQTQAEAKKMTKVIRDKQKAEGMSVTDTLNFARSVIDNVRVQLPGQQVTRPLSDYLRVTVDGMTVRVLPTEVH